VPGFASAGWQGWFMPAKTPPSIVNRVRQEVVKALALPDVRARLKAMAYEPVGSTPAEFDAFVRAEIKKFTKVIADAKIPRQ
jgi:tripartite-type tricarboxylate transporter receptor subunit TctC